MDNGHMTQHLSTNWKIPVLMIEYNKNIFDFSWKSNSTFSKRIFPSWPEKFIRRLQRSHGPMVKAPAYGAGDSRFESWCDRVILFFPQTYSVGCLRSAVVPRTNCSPYSDKKGHFSFAFRYCAFWLAFACSYSAIVFGWMESSIWWRFNSISEWNHVVSSRNNQTKILFRSFFFSILHPFLGK